MLGRAAGLSISNVDKNHKMHNTVDGLPKGVQWHCRELTVTGDLLDAKGKQLSKMVEVWYPRSVGVYPGASG